MSGGRDPTKNTTTALPVRAQLQESRSSALRRNYGTDGIAITTPTVADNMLAPMSAPSVPSNALSLSDSVHSQSSAAVSKFAEQLDDLRGQIEEGR